MKTFSIKKTSALMLSLFAFGVSAQVHQAHVHGSAELAIAMEAKEMSISFVSPAQSLLGFEHKASSEDEIAAVKKTMARLARVSTLFHFQGSGCKLVDNDIDVGELVDESSLSSQHSHDDHDHDHDHGHDHEDHPEDHKDEHDHHEHKHDVDASTEHFEISANYYFKCDNTQSLTGIDVELFNYFKGLEKVESVWISTSQQGAKTLTQADNQIKL